VRVRLMHWIMPVTNGWSEGISMTENVRRDI
jgi:hypothetical protein